jgi:hypothetical protein
MNAPTHPRISVVVPMHNEEEGVAATLTRLREALDGTRGSWEIVVVDDGSTDETRARALEAARGDERIRIVSYAPRGGRGRALRRGFAAAQGELVTSIDADLSYDPEHVVRMVEALEADPGLDIVLASAYMPGGSVAGVPPKRLWISRLGNAVLRRAYGSRWHTLTCIVRGYRRRALERLALNSDGKEIHLEVLSKAIACKMAIREIPGHLRARQKGQSKFRCGRTSATHLGWALAERPALGLGPLAALFAVLLLASAGAGVLGLAGAAAGMLGGLAGLGLTGGLAVIAHQLSEVRRQQFRLESQLHTAQTPPKLPRLAPLHSKSA